MRSAYEGPTFSYQSFTIDGVHELRKPLKDAEAEVTQLGSGHLQGRLIRAGLHDIGLGKGCFSLPVRASGIMSRTKLVVAIFLNCAESFKGISGNFINSGDIVTVPPGFEHHAVYNAPVTFAGLTIDPPTLSRFFARDEPFSDPEYWFKRRHFRRQGPETSDIMRQKLAAIFARLSSAEPLADQTADYLKRVAVESFIGQFIDDIRTDATPAFGSSVGVVRRVEAFVDAHQDRPIHISEICSELDLSRRTLHRCFADTLGMGPIAFLRYKRLCAAQSALQRGDLEETRVTQVAVQFGFFEFSRFARQYRSLFGENPHQTLHR